MRRIIIYILTVLGIAFDAGTLTIPSIAETLQLRSARRVASTRPIAPVVRKLLSGKQHGPTLPANYGCGPPRQTLFAPVIGLVPPGPNRSARAIDAVNRTIPFVRRFLFYPKFNPELEHVIDQMPPRASTLIRAGAFYADSGIPWKREADSFHDIAVSGRPINEDFAFSIVPEYAQPTIPYNFAGILAVAPTSALSADARELMPETVLGRLFADVSLENFGAAALLDMAAMTLRQTHRNRKELGDIREGEFNSHDHRALARMRHDAPRLSERLAHYFEIRNLLDEFATNEGPFLLINIDALIRTEALKPYPAVFLFYKRWAPRVTIDLNIIDQRGNRWVSAGFNHGRIRLVFGLRGGLLVPLNARWRPVGYGVDLSQVSQGQWRSVSRITVEKFHSLFGLENIDFTTAYRRTGDEFKLTSHMDSVPQLVAPPGIKQAVGLVAGEFLSGLAAGNGGPTISVTSGQDGNRVFHIAVGATAKLHYSPALAWLARTGDEIVNADDVRVRNDECRIAQEFFDALVADFDLARPEILALDRTIGDQLDRKPAEPR